LVLGDDPGLAVGQFLDREVGGVAAIGVDHRVRVEGLRLLEQEVHRDPSEARAELRPLGDAVDVAGDLLERELVELIPAPLTLLADHAIEPEAPFIWGDVWCRAGGQDGEALFGVLAWWQ